MIRMIGNHICKDCVSAMEVIQRERLPIEFHDMEKALDYVKEFLEIREGNPELYKEARENNQIGIPVFVLEDGTVTMDCDAAFEAARRAKNFARADEIRDMLADKGIILEDTRAGVKWKRA